MKISRAPAVWLLACLPAVGTAAQATKTQQADKVQKAIPQASQAAVVRAADRILEHIAVDGAITIAPVGTGEGRVVPYFAHFAGIGLADAYRVTQDRRYLLAARRWAGWYETHLNKDDTIYDYTGKSGAWKSTGTYDSSDAYAAGYHELVLAIYEASADKVWLKARVPFLKRALNAIRLTLQPVGLTEARPDYPWMYTMDNVSVIRGLRALTETARLLNDRALEETAARLTDRVTNSLETKLWDPNRQIWMVGLYPDGTKAEGLKDWYPDIMANLLTIGWMPDSPRNKELFGRLRVQFANQIPPAVRSADDLDRMIWWAYASHAAGDAALFRRLTRALQQFDKSLTTIDNVGYLGDICRILTLEPVGASTSRADATGRGPLALNPVSRPARTERFRPPAAR